jgi:hypothetical protein
MPNDLEDFLKRAAQRRAEQAALREQQKAAAGGRRPGAPEYTDRSRERNVPVLVEDDEEVFVAEVVPARLTELPQSQPSQVGGSMQDRHLSSLTISSGIDTTDEAFAERGRSFDNHLVPARKSVDATRAPAAPVAPPAAITAATIQKLLTSADGVRQAFLMREILSRPTDRW